MRARGFTILEIVTVMTIFGILSLVALPSIRAIATRKAEIEAGGETHIGLNVARDTAYKQLDCVEVKEQGGNQLTIEQFPCLTPDAGPPILVSTITYDRTVVGKPDIIGTGPVVFQPSGGLPENSAPRYVRIPMRSGRQAVFEIQPAIGTIRECRTYNAGPPIVCVD